MPTPAPPTTPQQTPGTPISGGNRLPPLGPAEKERYRNMFANTGAANGLLDGEQARTIFLRARLPNETLGQIWSSPRHTKNTLQGLIFVGVLQIFIIGEHWISRNSRLRCI